MTATYDQRLKQLQGELEGERIREQRRAALEADKARAARLEQEVQDARTKFLQNSLEEKAKERARGVYQARGVDLAQFERDWPSIYAEIVKQEAIKAALPEQQKRSTGPRL